MSTTARYTTEKGALVLVEESHALPIFQFNLTLRTGSTFDPPGKEGLSRMTARMVRMGTRRLWSPQVEDAIDAIGAQLSIGVGPSYVQFSGAVLARNLPPFLALLADLLRGPAFRTGDLSLLKRETIATLEGALDDDSTIAGRHFRRLALPDHPYGRSTTGTRKSVAAIRRSDVVAHFRQHYVAQNMLFGLSGPISGSEARDLFEEHFGFITRGERMVMKVPDARLQKGRRLVLVDKPERTQTQILIGTAGSKARDKDHVPLVVANTAFGGLFTSKLTTEVRAKRGWSYGASSGLGHQPQRDLWSMRTFPAAKDAPACIALQLRLLQQWIDKGISARDLKLAKSYLIKSHPFEFDTAQKRLDQAIDEIIFGLPRGFTDAFPGRVADVTRESARDAVHNRISARDQLIVVVATASELLPKLEKLPGLTDLQVIPYDQDW